MRLFIIGLTVIYAAGAVFAQSVMTRPDGCVSAADLSPHASVGVDAEDLNQWRSVGEEAAPIIDVRARDRSRDGRRLFTRHIADPETGEVFTDPCGPGE